MQNHCGPREVAREGLDLELERSSDSLTLTLQFRKQVVLQLSPDWGAWFGTVERKRWGGSRARKQRPWGLLAGGRFPKPVTVSSAAFFPNPSPALFSAESLLSWQH